MFIHVHSSSFIFFHLHSSSFTCTLLPPIQVQTDSSSEATPRPRHRTVQLSKDWVLQCTALHCTAHYAQHAVHSTLYTAQYTAIFTLHTTLYTTLHFKIYTLHTTHNTLQDEGEGLRKKAMSLGEGLHR